MRIIKVQSAMPLKQLQMKKIEEHFRRGKIEEVQFEYIINKSLLGGITVTDGNTVYDSSLQGKINTIKQILK